MGLASRIAARARSALAVAAVALAPAAAAQSLADTHVTGQFVGTSSDGSITQGTFDCKGEPTCTGGYQATHLEVDCSNQFSVSGSITITGLDLSHAGPLALDVTLARIDVSHTGNADGTCSVKPGSGSDRSVHLTGAWDGASQGGGNTTFVDNGGVPVVVVFAFTATRNPPPPPFPMTVTANITATSASATAQFQPRPEDVGKAESVFVFAHAPASQVKGAKRARPGSPGPVRLQDGGDPCVLAQVDPSGQLIAASASTLAPALTGVLTAQGQSVTLLNNVPTPGVAGATIFAGYGASSSSMLANGVYQGAVTIPGNVTCGTTLSTSAAPLSPGPLSGLWSNVNESGWGIQFVQRRNILFAAWYTYDAAGNPKWYVASSCAMPDGVTGASGTCTGSLYHVNGPAFFGVAFNPALENVQQAGTLQVAFTDADHATMTYTAVGQTRTVPITRQVFQTSSVPPAVDYTDLWYNAAEQGWGMAISHQFGAMFLAWFVYDAGGNPTWYVASNCVVSGNSCAGALYRTTGPPLGPAFDPNAVHVFPAGTVSLSFTDANTATLSYTVDGVSGTKSITRQTF